MTSRAPSARRRSRSPFLLLPVIVAVGWLMAAPAALAGPVLTDSATDATASAVAQRSALAGAPTQLSDSPPLKDLAGCLADRKVGDLVLLIDTSGSLGGPAGTDPTAVRVAAAQALLGRLSTSFAQVGAQVDISIAGFDDDVTQVVDWVPLDDGAVPGLSDQAASFKDRDKGGETDYWSALTWLNRTLQAKAQTRGPDLGASCQAALWLTDGEFTISARDGQNQDGVDPLTYPIKDIPGFEATPLTSEDVADAALAAAKTELCRAGGPADQLRAAKVTLIGVGLSRPGSDGSQFDFMKGYVENPSGSCGALPGHGVFVPAASVGDLFLALTTIFDPTEIQEDPQKLCQVSACPDHVYQLQLDNTVSKVRLAAVVDDGSGALLRTGIRVEITPPGGGTPIAIQGDDPDAGTKSTAIATADYRWYSGDPLTVDLTRVGPDWAGEWTVTFIDTTGQHPDAVSKINLSLNSDFAVQPVIVPGTLWRAGSAGQFELHPQDLSGADLAATTLPAGSVTTTTITLPGVAAAIPLTATTEQRGTFDIPADTAPGEATIRVDYTGQIAGVQSAPVTRQTTVQIQPQLGAPSVAAPNQVLDFGHIDGTATATATVAVTGPDEGEGCVTIATGDVLSKPQSVQSVTVTGANGADCFTVPTGQTVNMSVTLQPAQEGNGHLEGEITVRLSPASDPGRVSEGAIRYRAELERLPNVPVRTGILIGALLLGLLIPLALIWLVRRLTARFPSGDSVTLQSLAIEIKIGSAGLTRPDGSPLDLPQAVWSPVLPPAQGRRSLMVSGVPLIAKAGWRVTEPGYAKLDGPAVEDMVGASSVPPHFDSAGRPRLPLAVQGTWTVLAQRALATSPLAAVDGRLLLVVDTAADDQVRQHLIGSAVRDAPDLFEQARAKAKATGPTADDPSVATAPADSQYPEFGTPPSGEWGAPQPVPGWGPAPETAAPPWPGQGPASTAGDWGPPPPSGPPAGPPGPQRGTDGW